VQDDLRARLAKFSRLSEDEAELEKKICEAEKNYAAAASKLSGCRRAAAPRLAALVTTDLQQVAMEQAQFMVSLQTASRPNGLGEESPTRETDEAAVQFYSAMGADRVEFLLAANPGEKPNGLIRVASGGELSRLMLTLRAVAMNNSQSEQKLGETVVFDEIDAGIGGRVAEAVGRRLKSLAATKQVLCVTHQPQIARFADHHLLVTKSVVEGRTVTEVRELDFEQRIGELARMIGGQEEAAVATREAARWLLSDAERGEKNGLRVKKKRS
jgi:DNA repair protein RecN (Recombination protein N)